MESLCSSFPSFKDAHDSFFSHLPLVPEPPIFALMRAYAEDSNPVKLNLGMGLYRTEEGKPCVLPVVREAEKILLNDMSNNKEYLPTTGGSEFNRLSAKLVFGSDSPAITENRVITIQCVSGTGSMRIGAEILSKYYKQRVIYISQPTYNNHPNFFIATGIEVRKYRYYDEVASCLDIQGLLEDLSSAPEGAIVLLQSSAHNPTGVDPTAQQWEKIRQLMRSKQLLPFFDNAYQGFASGDLDQDAQPIRMFVADGGECLVSHSYSKIMGLYGERVGTLSIVCKTAEAASKLESYLKVEISSMYLTPPMHGAAIVTTILGNRDLQEKWIVEINEMAGRLKRIRRQLYEALCDRGTPGDWSHILRQVGMYTFSGLKEKQIAFMTKEYHIYMSFDGRINLGGLGSKTVPYLADAIHEAVTHVL